MTIRCCSTFPHRKLWLRFRSLKKLSFELWSNCFRNHSRLIPLYWETVQLFLPSDDTLKFSFSSFEFPHFFMHYYHISLADCLLLRLRVRTQCEARPKTRVRSNHRYSWVHLKRYHSKNPSEFRTRNQECTPKSLTFFQTAQRTAFREFLQANSVGSWLSWSYKRVTFRKDRSKWRSHSTRFKLCWPFPWVAYHWFSTHMELLLSLCWTELQTHPFTWSAPVGSRWVWVWRCLLPTPLSWTQISSDCVHLLAKARI